MIIMTEKLNNKTEKIMSLFCDFVGEYHLENICREIEGRKQEIDNTEVPESLDIWFSRYIGKIKRKEAIRSTLAKMKNFSLRAASFLFVVVASLFIVTISVDAVRIKVLNLLTENRNAYTSVRVDENPLLGWEGYYFPGYIPKGFHIESAKELKHIKHVEFADQKDNSIVFVQGPNGTDFNLDTENYDKTDTAVNSSKAILYMNSGEKLLIWNNEEFSFYIISRISAEEIIRIAESVEKK